MVKITTPIRKQAVGIDASKDTFDVTFMVHHHGPNARTRIRGSRKFKNAPSGFEAFQTWLLKKAADGVPLAFAIEATGVYHEHLTFFLHDRDYQLSVLLPNKVKAFARSLNQHAKTDEIDAGVIARLALERDLKPWHPAGQAERGLRALTRERQELTNQKTRHTNQLHALDHGYDDHRSTVKRLKRRIRLFEQHIATVTEEIAALCHSDEELRGLTERLRSIPQVGLLTAATVIAETGGFVLFESREQVVKYAGLDIVERQSGTSVKGRNRLSKRGNARLRRALYLPSVGMVNRAGVFRDQYERVLSRNPSKAQALVPMQRKLLVVMYALAKSGESYDPVKHAQAVKGVPSGRVKGVDEPGGSPTVTQLAEAGRS